MLKTKVCQLCSIDKPVSEFNKNSRKSDGLQNRCRSCTKEYNNQSYKTSEKRRKTIKTRNRTVRLYNRKFVSRYKRFCGCRLCSEREPVALDLHHIDPDGKDLEVSKLINISLDKAKVEIRKCVVLCANCHRKVHAGILIL